MKSIKISVEKLFNNLKQEVAVGKSATKLLFDILSFCDDEVAASKVISDSESYMIDLKNEILAGVSKLESPSYIAKQLDKLAETSDINIFLPYVLFLYYVEKGWTNDEVDNVTLEGIRVKEDLRYLDFLADSITRHFTITHFR